MMWRRLRLLLLLVVLLAIVAGQALTHARLTDWNEPIWVRVHPINADQSPAAAAFIRRLDDQDLVPVEAYLAREAAAYGVGLTTPVRVRLGPEIDSSPPELAPTANTPAVMLWSLQLRYWSWGVAREDAGAPPNIRIYLRLHDPNEVDAGLHSVGLSKAAIGVVNGYAGRSYQGRNLVVLTHELLHTLGASDKYDLGSNLPMYPAGYADPDREPRFPQHRAELMGGRIPLAPDLARMPESLAETVIGPATAREIGWLR